MENRYDSIVGKTKKRESNSIENKKKLNFVFKAQSGFGLNGKVFCVSVCTKFFYATENETKKTETQKVCEET